MSVKPNKIKRQKFVRSILKGKSQTQAAIDAGYKKESAYSTGSSLMKNPEVKRDLSAAMELYDIGTERLARELDKGLKESKVEGRHIEYLKLGAQWQGVGQDAGGVAPNVVALIQAKIGLTYTDTNGLNKSAYQGNPEIIDCSESSEDRKVDNQSDNRK